MGNSESNITTIKILIAVVIWLVVFIFGCSPICILHYWQKNHSRREQCLKHVGLISCLAGGVFLGAGMLHLFPELQENVQKAKKLLQIETHYPLAEFALLYGFLLVLCLEQVVLTFKKPVQLKSAQQVENTSSDPGDTPENADEQLIITDHAAEAVDIVSATEHVIRTGMLVASLSLHSLLEGIAVGMEPDLNSLLETTLAVVLHKIVLSFSLGLSLWDAELNAIVILWSLLGFSLTCPLGILIALGIQSDHQTAGGITVQCALQGTACGTFLFVIFFEILPKELHGDHSRLARLLFFLLGYALICVLLLWNPNSS